MNALVVPSRRAVVFPDPGPGIPVRVELLLSAWRPAGQDGPRVVLTAGGQTFNLFTNADRAWARDAKTDAAVVQQLIKSSAAVIKGTSSRNTPTTDTVSLTGFSAAYKAIGDTCKKPG